MSTHDWHLLDAQRGLEVRRTSAGYELRRAAQPAVVVPLTAVEFDQLRVGAELPEELR